MNDVYIKFEETGREGTVAVGTYLLNAAKRLGVPLECDCKTEEPENSCAVKVLRGVTLLSKPTAFETEHLSAAERKDRQRLACQVKIEKPGEIDVMTVKKETTEEKQSEVHSKTEEFKEEFKDLPLKEKISSLVELEMMALGDTISYVVNSPYEAVGKVMEVMAEFGMEKEKKEQKSAVPDEHAENGSDEKDAADKKAEKSTATARKSSTSKTTAAKRTRKRRKPVKKDEEDKG